MAAATSWPAALGDERRLVAAVTDPHLRRALTHLGAERRMPPSFVDSPAAVLRAVEPSAADVVVLARTAPGLDGLRVLETLRARSAVPVVVVSHVDSESDRILAYELGADDYLVVPCSTRELGARIDALIRRASPGATATSAFGALHVDRAGRAVTVAGVSVDLTRREFDLLACLTRRPRRTFTREELLREVWGSSAAWQSPATVTEHVRRVRRKLDPSGSGPAQIVTVHGVGYRFDP